MNDEHKIETAMDGMTNPEITSEAVRMANKRLKTNKFFNQSSKQKLKSVIITK